MIKFLLPLTLLLAGCSIKDAKDVTVLEDRNGGNMALHVLEREQLKNTDTDIIIRGELGSAATIFATLPNACIEEDAVLRFHRPTDPLNGVTAPVWINRTAIYFSGEARELYEDEWTETREETTIPATEFVELERRAKICK